MTQAELEQLAKKMRDRGLHSTWVELMEFSRDVIGNLADVYQALLRGISSPSEIYLNDTNAVIKVIINKLASALTILTSEEQVSRWRDTALSASDTPNTE